MTRDLLPCPFCGPLPKDEAPADATRILGSWNLIHRCKVMGPLKVEAPTEADLVKKWNTRAKGGER